MDVSFLSLVNVALLVIVNLYHIYLYIEKVLLQKTIFFSKLLSCKKNEEVELLHRDFKLLVFFNCYKLQGVYSYSYEKYRVHVEKFWTFKVSTNPKN